MVVFETFAIVRLLKKEHGYEEVAKRLKEGGFISAATLYELLYVTTRDYLDQGHDLDESIRRSHEIVSSLLTHLKKQELTEEIMHAAVHFKIKYNRLNLSHFDCLGLATASVLKLPLFSGEKGLAQVKEIKVLG